MIRTKEGGKILPVVIRADIEEIFLGEPVFCSRASTGLGIRRLELAAHTLIHHVKPLSRQSNAVLEIIPRRETYRNHRVHVTQTPGKPDTEQESLETGAGFRDDERECVMDGDNFLERGA